MLSTKTINMRNAGLEMKLLFLLHIVQCCHAPFQDLCGGKEQFPLGKFITSKFVRYLIAPSSTFL